MASMAGYRSACGRNCQLSGIRPLKYINSNRFLNYEPLYHWFLIERQWSLHHSRWMCQFAIPTDAKHFVAYNFGLMDATNDQIGLFVPTKNNDDELHAPHATHTTDDRWSRFDRKLHECWLFMCRTVSHSCRAHPNVKCGFQSNQR